MSKLKKRLVLIGKIGIILILLNIWIYFFIDFKVAFNNNKVTLWCHTPSIVEAGENFTITVEAWDEFERLAGSFGGEISFQIESYNYTTLLPISSNYTLPKNYTFTSTSRWGGIIPAYLVNGADNGKKSFQMSISTPGIHYIKIIETHTGYRYRSNPIIVKPVGTASKRLYWGDLHGHTTYSDGSGLPEDAYKFARYVSLLDFAALTDHSEHFLRIGDIDLFNLFQKYIEITNSFNIAGKFVTLVAMEWTPKYVIIGQDVSFGHINVYFRGNSMPYFSTYTQRTPYELYDHIKQKTHDEFIAWTHHTLRSQFASDYAFNDDEINRMIEIYSVHGSCECIGNDNLYPSVDKLTEHGYSVRDALRMGRKYGIMASGDTHDGRLGHSISHTEARCLNQYPYTFSGYRFNHPYPGGLTGIFTSNLNRTAVFDALKSRSGYATTWVNRHYLEFKINGISVGQNESTVYVTQLNIYKNSELWKSFDHINSPIWRTNLTDNSLITGANYTHFILKNGKYYIHKKSILPVNISQMNTDGADYYYIRMTDSNGGAAWMGPIWVEVRP